MLLFLIAIIALWGGCRKRYGRSDSFFQTPHRN